MLTELHKKPTGRLATSQNGRKPLVLHVRTVDGVGRGPDKTILNSPRFLEPLGYQALCAYMYLPAEAGFDALRERATQARTKLICAPARGLRDWRIVVQCFGE